ncbi:MAG: RdgB/HAM1 family non-canonical purine NTP pyrophosphatase [Synergistaceae bacterium]
MKIVLASGNRHKYTEMKEALEKIGIELLFGGDFENAIEVEENGKSYEENALLKAKAWAEMTGLPAMSDDSGIEVDALNGKPGIHSARIVPGSDNDRIKWMLTQLKDKTNRNAHFVSCIVVVFNDGRENIICQKKCEGKITEKISGNTGFGYDPIFIPTGYEKTFAELGDEIKRKISHRALAIKGLAEKLKVMI